jgi:hypothetical protein
LGPWEDAVLRDEVLGVEIGTEWEIGHDGLLRIAAGLPVRREITFDDDAGRTLFDENLDTAPFLGITLNITL